MMSYRIVAVRKPNTANCDLPAVLVVAKSDKEVSYLSDTPADHPDHPRVVLLQQPLKEFNASFAVSSKDAVDATVALFKERMKILGCTEAAAKALDVEHTTNLTIQQQKDHEAMATKAAAASKTKAPTKTTNKAGTVKAAVRKQAEKQAAGKAGAPKTTVKTPAPKTDTSKKPSAAARIRDLIMEGKLTDDKIFETVQKEFGLDDGKRGYVAWYRNDLKKKGMNPPAPKA